MSIGNPNLEHKENLRRISKIHFLVHPRFLSDYRENFDVESAEDLPIEYNKLLDKYVSQARNLKEDEIMVALTHTPRNDYKEDSKEGFLYFRKVEAMFFMKTF